jgi:hypothetical protein
MRRTKSPAQGAGAPTFDHAMRIKDHLKTRLSIELSKGSARERPPLQILEVDVHPMDDQERIQHERRSRFTFLKHLYDENRKLDPEYIQSISAQAVGEADHRHAR